MNDLNDLTYLINGCAMKVHSTLGNGFQEVIYQRALAIELNKAGISHKREVEQVVFYDGVEVGTRRADFVIGDKIIVELKALVNIENLHIAQTRNYLVAYNFPLGLLINFGANILQFKRIYNNNYKSLSESGL